MEKSENRQLENLQKISALVDNHWSPEQIGLIKATVAKGTTDTELAFFGNIAKSLNLNPFNKEIWCYKDYKGNLITFAGRDGFLKIAQSDKRWNGMVSFEVCENDIFEMNVAKGEINHSPKFTERGNIIGAYCYIKPKGTDTATIEWADFKTYFRTSPIWKSHPGAMIKKIAETNALKKAFGISGLQSEYEFEVNNNKVYAIDTYDTPDLSTINYIEQLINTSTFDDEQKAQFERELSDISNQKADELINMLKLNQVNRIESGDNYDQSDIKEQLNRHCG